MIFDNNNAAFRFINAIYISENAGKSHINSRTFCALSYRINSDTEILSNNKKIKLKSGDIAFFPVNTTYSRISKKEELIAVHFEIFNDATRDICVYTPQDRELFSGIFKKILSVYEAGKPGYIYEANSLLNKIFMHICEERQNIENHSDKFIAAREYIEKNYANPQLLVSDIADYCGISEGYLRRLFKKEASVSPKLYLNTVRMQHAASLINCGFYSISQVSEMVGFYDPKYFSAAYKKYIATAPRSYRNNDEIVHDYFGR